MQEQFVHQAVKHAHAFFLAAKLNKKKWYREIKNDDELLYSFFVLRRRMIQPKKYVVHESDHLHGKNIKPEALRDYELLKKAMAENGDLKKFHTENSKILYPIDGLLEEYNINHLHLDRSRYQVFFIAEGNEIFMVNICKHFERNRTGHSKNSLLEIVSQNWPEKKNKKYHIEKNKSVEKYASAYGWEKLSLFYEWLNIALRSLDDLNKYELAFIDNSAFVINEINSQTTVDTILPFKL